MLTIVSIDTATLGDRSYLAHDGTVAVVVDPQRDIDRVLDLAATAGVRIMHVFETHIHNDQFTGGYALAAATGAAYHVNADDEVTFDREPMRDGDVVAVGDRMRITAMATPGHTFTHLAYALDYFDGTEWLPVGCSPADHCCTARSGARICSARSTPTPWPATSTPPPIGWPRCRMTPGYCPLTGSAASAPRPKAPPRAPRSAWKRP